MNDLTDTLGPAPSVDAVRADVRAWLTEAWSPTLGLREWRERLVAAGWAQPSWPVEWYGRALPAWADGIVAAELHAVGAPGLPLGVGPWLAAPTLLEHGPDPVRSQFLHGILTGATTWCQLFSEPGAGSDLAGLTTHAELDGDRWIVTGQKLWNTSAHHADYGILVARTNWDVPKHRGLTYFVLPMRQPGVEVRSVRQMNEHRSFNEVFLSEAELPADWVVGAVGDGWKVALTTLAHERRFAGNDRSTPTGDGPALQEARRERDEYLQTYRWYPQRAGRVDLAVPHARAAGLATDPVARYRVAGLLSVQRAAEWTAARARSARAAGKPPGAEGSIGKLTSSDLARRSNAVHTGLAGACGMLHPADPQAPFDGMISEVLLSTPAQSIAGGTDEIQHNIIGERVLGLPREPGRLDDVPFRDVPRNG